MKIVLTTSVLLLACCTTVQDGTTVAIHEKLDDDAAYAAPLKDATRKIDVIDNFESVYSLSVTYLSPEFLRAFNTRLGKYFQYITSNLKEAEQKTGFFVSIYSPDDKIAKLDDKNLWDVYLETSSGKIAPTIVKKLKEKERWTPFFGYINTWSSEYFILFDTPGVSVVPSEGLIARQKHSVKIVFTDTHASSVMSW